MSAADKMAEALRALMQGCVYRTIADQTAWHEKSIPTNAALDVAREALAEWESGKAQPSVPDGMVLVPKEPTVDMLVAGQEAWICTNSHGPAVEDCEQSTAVWSAMLAAAPTSPQAAEQAVQAAIECEALKAALPYLSHADVPFEVYAAARAAVDGAPQSALPAGATAPDIFESHALEQASKMAIETMRPYREAREVTYREALKNATLLPALHAGDPVAQPAPQAAEQAVQAAAVLDGKEQP